MEFRILGPLEVLEEGRRVALGGSKPRALLALLLLHRGETLGTERLVDELWGERPPATAAKSLRVHVSRLRKALAAGQGGRSEELLVTRGHGYQLVLDPERLDAHRFERLVAEGRGELAAGRPRRAAAALEGALSLWRGRPLDDLAYEPFAQNEVARLEDLRLAATEELVEARLALGRHAEVVAQLEGLIAEHPYRERPRAQLMLALYRCDRQAEALQVYQDARRALVEELGIEPGERLRELERAILAQDPALAVPAALPATDGDGEPSSAAGELPTGVVTFLLTDIEGSSGLWEADAGAMAGALELHDRLIACAVAAHGGLLLKAKGEGDATLTVFRRASDAAAGAVELQGALRGAAWPDGLDPRVRVALHTGEAHEREGDYFGPALNRAARLRSLARGGTIVLSQATAEIVRERLPPGAELVELGRRELRGLSRPENVFELRATPQPAPAGASAFKAQRTTVAREPDAQDPDLEPVVRPRPLAARRRPLALALVGAALILGAGLAAVIELTGKSGESGGITSLAPGSLGIIDPGSNRILKQLPVAGRPTRLATDGRSVWVAGDDSRIVSSIDPRARPAARPVPVGGFPSALAVGEGAVWVLDGTKGLLKKIDPAYRRIVATARVAKPNPLYDQSRQGTDPTSVAAGLGSVWVTDGSRTLTRVDPATARIVKRIELHARLDGVAVGAGAVWVISGASATVIRVDREGGATDRIPIVSRPGFRSPYPLSVAAGEGFVWVLNGNTGTVTKINPKLRGISRAIRIGLARGPARLAVGAGAAWVADADGSLTRINPTTNAATPIPLAHGLKDVAVAARRVWVTAGSGLSASAAPTPHVTSGRVRALPTLSCTPIYYQGRGPPQHLIAADLPLGPNGAQQLDQAIRYVLRQHRFRAGRYAIAYQACDDWTPTGFSAKKDAANAHTYARDRSVIGVIGPVGSPQAQDEIAIANRAPGGPLAMVNAWNTYVGLTHASRPGTAPDEPGRYYPTGKRNYVRIVAADDVQGAADALLARRLGVKRVYLMITTAGRYGPGIAAAFKSAAARRGIAIAGSHSERTPSRSYKPLAARVARAGADAVFLASFLQPGTNSGTLIKDLRTRLGQDVRIIAPDGFADFEALVSVAGPAAEDMTVSVPGLPNERLPAPGRRFVADFGATVGERPGPDAVRAAQATNVLLAAIARSDGTRASVTRELFNTKVTDGLIGSFSIDRNGDINTAPVTIYQIAHGKPRILTTRPPPPGLVH